MAETTNNILTRIALKIDTYENWTNISAPGQGGNLVLKRGEIGLCEIPSGNLEATTAPTVLFKVGDGTNIFKDLKWASALAADVYAWAKAKTVSRNGKILEFKDDKGAVIDSVTFDYLTQTEVDARVTAITGTLASLTTTNKTSLVNAVNEHDTEIGDLSQLNTTNKTSLVNAVNEALQAVETGGTGSVVTITKDTNTANTDTYTVTQGSKAVGDKVTVGTADLTVEATGALSGSGTFNANSNTDKTITITHNDSGVTAGQYGADDVVTVGAGETKTINVPSVTVDAKGHVTAAADKVLSISIPELPSNHVTTDTYQTITANKTFDNATITLDGPEIYDGTELEYHNTLSGKGMSLNDGENGNTEYTASGITIHKTTGETVVLSFPNHYADNTTETQIATLQDVERIAAGAVDYLGTVTNADALTTFCATAGFGDFCRVSVAFGSYHAGDLLVNESEIMGSPSWVVIHGEEGDITEVTTNEGLQGGGASGTVTVGIADGGVTEGKIATNAVTTNKIKDTNVTKAKLATAVQTSLDKADNAVPNTTTVNGHALSGNINLNANDVGAAVASDITNAINALDVADIAGMGAGKTIKTLTETDGKIAATFQDISITHNQVSDFDTKANALITAKVNTLDSSVAATAATNDEYSVLTGVTQTDGKLTDKTEVKLAKIAKTGSLYDNTNGATHTSTATADAGAQYILFDCGTSTTVI